MATKKLFITPEDVKAAEEKYGAPKYGALGSVVDSRTYLRWLPDKKRRETFYERNARVVNYNIGLALGYEPTTDLEQEAIEFFDYMNQLLVWGSGRTAWVAGTKATDLVPESTMNCSAAIVDRLEVFGEAFHLLCLGCGFGFRIYPEDVKQIPELIGTGQFVTSFDTYNPVPKEVRREDTVWYFSYSGNNTEPKAPGCLTIKVGDSREGWVAAIIALLQLYTHTEKTNYFDFTGLDFADINYVNFNFDNVRPEGERIKGFGGIASGPQPLITLLKEYIRIFEEEVNTATKKLKPINCMDMMCIMGDVVRSGNVRRSSLITLFHRLDKEVRLAKQGLWSDPKMAHKRYRSMSNNSILYDDGYKPSLEEMKELMQTIRFEGEPGFVRADLHKQRRHEAALAWRPSEDPSWYTAQAGLTNPCAEINLTGGYKNLKAGSFCNLVSVPLPLFVSYDGQLNYELLKKCVSLITRFALRQTLIDISLPDWDLTQKKERLLGVDLCGLWEAFDKMNVSVTSKEANNVRAFCKKVANTTATEYSQKLGIERPLLVTAGKPNGCLTENYLRTFSEGLLYIEEVSCISDLGVLEVDRNLTEPSTKNKVTCAYNNGLSETLLITMQNGRQIQCTPEHPLYIKDTGFVEAKHLSVGDKLDFYQDDKPLYYSGGSYQTLTQASNERRFKRKIKQPLILDEDLAWFLGHYFANGSHSLVRSKHIFRIHSGYKPVIAKTVEIFQSKFGYKPYVYFYKDRESVQVEWSSIQFSMWLEINGLDKTKATSLFRIPELIRKSPYSVLMAFIAGYTDGDGCLSRGSFSIDSTSKQWIEHIIQVMEALGFSCSLIENSHRNSHGGGSLWKANISKTYSLKYAFDEFNKYSVKAIERPLVHSDKRNCKYPYTVKSVVDGGFAFTYDIEVENSHFYYQGGLKSHNTYAQLTTIASGCHPPYAPYYIRRIRIAASDALAKTLVEQGIPFFPETSEWESYVRNKTNWAKPESSVWEILDMFDSNQPLPDDIKTLVFEFPVKTAATRATSEISAIEQLENYKAQVVHYVDHNQSVTVTVGDDEWDTVAQWFVDNWEYVLGISLLPKFADNVYPLLPYQECTEEEFNRRVSEFPEYPLAVNADIMNRYEAEIEAQNRDVDDVDVGLAGECSAGGSCPVR